MLQSIDEKSRPLTVAHSLCPFFKQPHLGTVKQLFVILIIWSCLFFQTFFLSSPAFSQSEEVYPEGDKEYFKALIELEQDDEYKQLMLQNISYAGDKKVEYIDYKGSRPVVDEEGAKSSNNVMDAAHFRKQTYKAMRNMDWFRKNNYQNFIRKVGQNIYPLIIASDFEPGKEGVGTTYYLYRRGFPADMVTPTSVNYEMEKILSHMPMGVFILISPYFDNVANRPKGWEEPLVEYKKYVGNIKELFEKGDFSQATSIRAIKMLDIVNDYLHACIEKGSGDEKSYSAFSNRMMPYIAEAMNVAVESQIQAGLSALSQWKKELGPQEWDKLHVLIPVVWPVAIGNPRRQLFEHLMTPERAKTNIIEVHARSHDEARTTLGRIKGDTVMAGLTFDKSTHFGMMSYLRLSSPTDLVQGISRDELKKHPKANSNVLPMKAPQRD